MLGRKEVLVCILAFVAAIVVHYYVGAHREHVIAGYYSILENQESIRDDVQVKDDEVALLEKCRSVDPGRPSAAEECMRDFYDRYTSANGPEKAFAHLARLQRDHPDLLPGCHYISHGIGHAALRLNGDDPYKAFTMLESGAFFKNIVTCGNGYFHGVIEEYSKGEKDKDKLATMLGEICADDRITNKGNCFHGIGHAAMIQTEYSIPDMLYICDRVVPSSPENVFGCETGGFMEYGQRNTVSSVEHGKMKFEVCDTLEKKYQAACYLEHSSEFERFSSESRNYTRNIGFCRQIDDAINRMACIKLFAIRAVRIVHYEDIYEMCRNTSSAHERIMCTAIMADRLGGSIDAKRKGDDYAKIVQDVCGTMNLFYAYQCTHLIRSEGKRLFYTSEADLHFSTAAMLPRLPVLLNWIHPV